MPDTESKSLLRHADDEWVMDSEEATSLHIGPSEVVIDGKRYVPESRLILALALLYKTDTPTMVAVAKLCDERLDKRGALLGYVREAASRV